MRHRHQQSMPFGWVLVALTLLGAIGGVVTGLSAHSIRTAGALPAEEPEPFERAQSMVASLAAPAPAAEGMTLASATSTPWLEDEDSGLFSPVLTYPARGASAPASAAAVAPVATPASASSEPAAAPAPAASQPAPQPAAAKPAPHQAASRPGGVLNDAQIASIKKRLNLTPDQEALWPAVESALRNVSYVRRAREIKVASAGSAPPMAYVDTNSAEVQQLKYAALPLIMRLNDDQKREVKSLAYVMGLGSVASGF
jgi:hypothetical protein